MTSGREQSRKTTGQNGRCRSSSVPLDHQRSTVCAMAIKNLGHSLPHGSWPCCVLGELAEGTACMGEIGGGCGRLKHSESPAPGGESMDLSG